MIVIVRRFFFGFRFMGYSLSVFFFLCLLWFVQYDFYLRDCVEGICASDNFLSENVSHFQHLIMDVLEESVTRPSPEEHNRWY